MKEILCIQVLSWVRVAFTQWYRFSTKVCEFSCSALENILTGSKSLSSCCFSFIQFFLCLSLHYPRFQSTLDFQQKRKKRNTLKKQSVNIRWNEDFPFGKRNFFQQQKSPSPFVRTPAAVCDYNRTALLMNAGIYQCYILQSDTSYLYTSAVKLEKKHSQTQREESKKSPRLFFCRNRLA